MELHNRTVVDKVHQSQSLRESCPSDLTLIWCFSGNDRRVGVRPAEAAATNMLQIKRMEGRVRVAPIDAVKEVPICISVPGAAEVVANDRGALGRRIWPRNPL